MIKRSHSTGVLQASVAILLLSVTLAGCGGGSAAKLKNPSNKPTPRIADSQKISPEELLFEESVGQLTVSPDGSKVAWLKVSYVPDSAVPLTELYVTGTGDLSTTQVAPGFSVSVLKWSPDSGTIAFASSTPAPGTPAEEAGAQVWKVTVGGGAPSQVTQAPGGVVAFDWRGPDRIVFAAPDIERSNGAEKQAVPGDDTIHVTDTSDAVVNLF
jgi:Tol biopolymer transport system component